MSRPHPLRAMHRWWSRRRRATKIAIWGGFFIVFLAFIGVCAIVYSAVRIPLPANVALPQQTVVTYSNGQRMDTIGSVNRTDVPLSDVPVGVRQAVLAAEDRNFYSEAGVSIRGIGRALVADVTGGGIKQGGSTITQQYAKNAYLGQERTFTRKIKEIALAIKISRKYSKDDVLGFYLNTIYFGRGAYGIQAASESYFGVPVNQLTPEQGAVIAGLIRAPSVLDPAVSPNSARVRWGEVMDQMVKDKALTVAQRAAAVYPKTIAPKTAAQRSALQGPTSFIDVNISTFLKAQLGEQRVALGGLTVTTTIDQTAQAAAESAVAAKSVGAPADQREALVAMDPKTGAVRAYYGGAQAGMADAADFLAAPPGSSFKPITLAAALENGASLTDTENGASPQTFNGASVRNFGGEEFGRITLLEATAQSVNTAYLHLAQQTGPDKIVSLARSLGIPDSVQLEATPEIALGTDSVRAIDMAKVYSAFANNGQTSTPYFVQKVVDRKGNVLYQADVQQSQVLGGGTAQGVTQALQGVLTNGTAVDSQLAGGRPAAGKTGTTSGSLPNTAAWFDGYTPQLLTIVGFFRPNTANHDALQSLTPYPACGCSEVTGGTLPAQTWKLFMDSALAGQPIEQFQTVAQAPVVTSTTPTSASSTPRTTVTTTTSSAPPTTITTTSSAPPTESPTPSDTPTDTPTPTPTPTPTEVSTSPDAALEQQRTDPSGGP
jgi:membrane peptidoglycan carboxypeptidase